MGGLTVAELTATLGLDDTGFGQGLDGIMGKFAPFELGGLAAAAAVGGGLIAAAGAALALGEEFDAAYDHIRIGTGATGKALDGLQDSFNAVVQDVPASFGDASTAIADLNTRLGLTGDALRDSSGQFLELSRITGTNVAENIRFGTRLFGDWSIASSKQSGALDELFRATQQSGIGLADLMQTVVQFGAPLRAMGFTFEESIAMLSKWEKEGVNISTVLAGMRMGLKTFSKDGENASQGLARAFDEIAKAKTMAAAMKIGNEVFGVKGATDVVAAVREGRFQYDALVKSIAGGSDTIMKAARDTQDMGEAWTKMTNTLKVKAEPALTKFFNFVSDAAKDPLGWDENAAVRALMSSTDKLTAQLPKKLGMAAIRARYILDDLRKLEEQPQVLGDIHADHTMKQLKDIRDEVAQQLQISVREANQIMGMMFDDWKPEKTLSAKADRSIGEVENRIAGLRAKLARNLAFGKLDNLPLIQKINDLEDRLKKLRNNPAWSGLKLHFDKSTGKSVDKVVSDVDGAIDRMAAGAGKGGRDASRKLAAGLGQVGPTRAAAARLGKAAKPPMPDAFGLGADIANGVAAGIDSAASTVALRAEQMVQQAMARARAAADAHSPSRKMMLLGGQMAEGLALGLDGGSPGVRSATERMMSRVERDLSRMQSVSLGVGPSSTAAGGRGRGGSVGDPGGATVVQESVHVHVHLPGGTTLVGEAQRVGEILAPHVGRAIERTRAARDRGR